MKKTRVSIIKNNITQGTQIPKFKRDCDVGHWVDSTMATKGHYVDATGLVDMPDYNIDNKSRKKGSLAHYTVGSMTIYNIINTAEFRNTRFYAKVQNQNQVTYDPVFREISNVKIVDMDIDLIQQKLADGYADCREQLLEGNRNMEIKSANGWVVFDGYGSSGSYRMRIPNSAMKKIHNIAGARDTYSTFFEECQ
jgi:hypothetical protein